MRPLALLCFLLLAGGLQAGTASGAERVRLYVSGTPGQEVQMGMGRDLARLIARDAEIELDVRGVAGTPEALLRLRESSPLQLAIVQSDAALAYFAAMQRGNSEALKLIDPVRVVAPLHEEEIHFVVRADSPLSNLQDLAEARINLGAQLGNSALTATLLYRRLFGKPIPDSQANFLPTEEALVKLITERSIDAVVVVGARPVRLLANMKPEARQFVKLLKLDTAHPEATALRNDYATVTVLAADYPGLIEADQPALAVRMLLVAAGHSAKSRATLVRFSQSWCRNFARLQYEGVPQWGGVTLGASRAQTGWTASHVVTHTLRACIDGVTLPSESCSHEDRALGLCE